MHGSNSLTLLSGICVRFFRAATLILKQGWGEQGDSAWTQLCDCNAQFIITASQPTSIQCSVSYCVVDYSTLLFKLCVHIFWGIFFPNYLETIVLSGCTITQVLPLLRDTNDRMVKDLLDLQGRKTRACSLHQELGQNSTSSRKVCGLVLDEKERWIDWKCCCFLFVLLWENRFSTQIAL